ncbi:MAG: Sfum_1244 family protein [Pseudomonadota bacterium]
MAEEAFEELIQGVQRNCDIADARHGADFGICSYLLKMREYFRWEKGFGLSEHLPREDIGDWLSRREAHWETLVELDFGVLRIDDAEFDPFDADGINGVLEQHGLAYSSGLIGAGKPHFFLAHLDRLELSAGEYSIRVCGRELARGLNAPPAMARDGNIFLRREALRRYLWERLEMWRWKAPANALGRAFACYDFDSDTDAALDSMTETEMETVLRHEIGEVRAGRLLGDAWNRMLKDLLQTPAELMARAVRDNLADCTATLPYLAGQGHDAPVHFFVGALGAMRKQIFPGLPRAYEEWRAGGDTEPLAALAQVGKDHWARLALDMLHLHLQHGPAAAGPMAELVEGRAL